jgi:hypothetical protein
MLRAGMQIREIAASAARDANFFSQFGCMVQQHHALAAPGGDRSAHHAGRAGAYHCHIELHCHADSNLQKPHCKLRRERQAN